MGTGDDGGDGWPALGVDFEFEILTGTDGRERSSGPGREALEAVTALWSPAPWERGGFGNLPGVIALPGVGALEQRGQRSAILNHSSRQLWWKAWPHPGCLQSQTDLGGSRQIAHVAPSSSLAMSREETVDLAADWISR